MRMFNKRMMSVTKLSSSHIKNVKSSYSKTVKLSISYVSWAVSKCKMNGPPVFPLKLVISTQESITRAHGLR